MKKVYRKGLDGLSVEEQDEVVLEFIVGSPEKRTIAISVPAVRRQFGEAADKVLLRLMKKGKVKTHSGKLTGYIFSV